MSSRKDRSGKGKAKAAREEHPSSHSSNPLRRGPNQTGLRRSASTGFKSEDVDAHGGTYFSIKPTSTSSTEFHTRLNKIKQNTDFNKKEQKARIHQLEVKMYREAKENKREKKRDSKTSSVRSSSYGAVESMHDNGSARESFTRMSFTRPYSAQKSFKCRGYERLAYLRQYQTAKRIARRTEMYGTNLHSHRDF